MKTEITKNLNNAIITVTIDQVVLDKVAYADGGNINIGKEANEFITISVIKGDLKVFTHDINFFYVLEEGSEMKQNGAYARLGDSYLSKETYDSVNLVLEEARSQLIEEEYNEVKKGQNEKTEVELKQADRGFGFCHKCESYCYGDCEASA